MPKRSNPTTRTPIMKLEIKTGATESEKVYAKQQFKIHKNSSGTLDPSKVKLVIKRLVETENDFDETDQVRVETMAKRIEATKGAGITFGQLWRLCQGKVDVQMLNKLFHEHNQSDDAKVEPFLVYDECREILKKLYFAVPDETLRVVYNRVDDTNDGNIQWEGFLSLSTELFGDRLEMKSADGGGGGDFNELRTSIDNMKVLLKKTNQVIKKYELEIENKQQEIGNILGDMTHKDTMKRLKQALDVKDQLEQSLMGMKIKQFSMMKDYLMKLDTEKTDIADKYSEEVRNRNMDREKVARIRRTFKNEMKHHFLSFPVLIHTLGEIDRASQEVNVEIDKAIDEAKKTDLVYKDVSVHEKPPQPSVSTDAINFLRAQRSIIDEISTKMQMMQRERDKYEDMIAEEIAKNKEKRLECVNLNMEITNLEGEQMLQEAKLKDQRIQNMTLKAAVEAHVTDKDSKKVKALKNTAFQFSAEEEEVWTEIRETGEKLKETKRRITVSKNRVSRLNIELGELKIILENIVATAEGVGADTDISKMMKNLGDGGDAEWEMGADTWKDNKGRIS